MDFGALPPEINSARMYAGPGPGSMLAAAAAWKGLAAELHSAASSYGSVISGLTTEPWLGPSSVAMAAAATPYVAWMSATAERADLAGTQALAATGAYETAYAMTVPPPLIAANRAQQMMLIATNFLGQNTPAIAALEAQYMEMWAQDAAAMYGYAGASAATTAKVTPFTAAPQTTNPAGLATQGTTVGQATGTSAGTTSTQAALASVVTTTPTALNSLASPAASTASTVASTASAASTSTTTPLGVLSSSSGFSLGSLATSVMSEYAAIPGWSGMFVGSTALAPLMNPDVFLPFMSTAAAAPLAEGAAGAAAGAAQGALGSGFAGGLGGLAGLGQAASVGGLSVPPSWGLAATGPAAMLGGVPLASPLTLPDTGFGAGSAAPMMFGGLPRAAAAGAGGTGVAKYGSPLTVMARPPAAGYPNVPLSPATPAAGLPPAAPGYRPAIVYLPTNGHEPALV